MTTYNRSDIEKMKFWNRPSVRCRLVASYVNQDGQRRTALKDTTGRIDPHGGDAWITISTASLVWAERFSWDEVLETLNDPYAPPLHIIREVEYEE